MRVCFRLFVACSILAACTATFGQDSAETEWPFYRGPNGDGTVRQRLRLVRDARELWTASVAKGWSSMTIKDGRLYTFGTGRQDNVVCLDANTGRQIWTQTVGPWQGDATPVVAGGRVFVLSANDKPTAYCFDARDGRKLWERPMPKPMGERHYGHAGSPLVFKDTVILNAGGGVALKQATGEIVWEHTGFPGLATPVLFDHEGKPAVALFGGDKLIARDASTGRIIWSIPWKTDLAVNACNPVFIGKRMFVCSNYGLRPVMYDLSGDSPRKVWQADSGHAYASGFAHGGRLYAFLGGGFTCLDPATGEPHWRSGGDGSALLIGEHLVRVNSRGQVEIGRLTQQRFTPDLRFDTVGGQVWNAPAYANGRLYIRNKAGNIACYQISQTASN